MKFSYVAKDKQNKQTDGQIEAKNESDAFNKLEKQGLLVIDLHLKPEKAKQEIVIGGVSTKDKVFLAKNLSTMIKSGLSLVEALEVIEQESTGALKNVMTDVLEQVRAGKALNVALAVHPKVFDPLFINMVKIGEKSGTVEKSLLYLAGQLQKDAELQGKVRNASIYPTIILFATLGIGGAIAYFVLPKLTDLFSSFDAELPWATRLLLWFSNSLENDAVWWLIGILTIIILILLITRTKFFHPFWSKTILLIPIFGNLNKNLNLARFSLTAGTLLKSGVSISESLRITAEAIDSTPYQDKIYQILEIVKGGKSVAEGIDTVDPKSKLFPAILREMIKVGERTGKLDENLLYLATYYEEEVSSITDNLATTLEPVLLIIVGLFVAFIAVAVISPMYQLLTVIQ